MITTPRRLLAGLLVCVGASVAAGPAWAVPTTEFALAGDVLMPGVYTLPGLSLLPPATETATYKQGGAPVTDTYTGVSIWNLLGEAGLATNPTIKNDVLLHYVVATGSDGYRAVVSAGEIAPKFGNQPDLVADADTGGQLTPSPGPDGFARLVLPGDSAGGRYVSNISGMVVGAAAGAQSQGGGISSRFRLDGQVAHPGVYALPALRTLPATTETATYLAAGHSVTDTYTGVSLWTLLSAAGLVTDAAIKNDILRKIVVATGSDGYAAVFALGEIDPFFGHQPDLVAYADTGGQLGEGGLDGFARLVTPGDIAGGRYVSNLVSLQVLDTTSVPEPAALALLAPPLLLLAVARRVRRGSDYDAG